MSLRNRLILPVIFSSLAFLAACGGGTSNPPVNPPPSGGFANSNLNGTYVFSVTGTDNANNFVTVMGTFTADGKGNITAGVLEQNGTAGAIAPSNITSGTYTVGSDGRPTGSSGLANGLLTVHSGAGTYSFDFVLTSSQHGLITEFDSIASASGTLDLQANVTQASIKSQSYAFNFTGTSGTGSTLCGLTLSQSVMIPYATVGNFTLDSNGNITTGLEDFNNNCSSSGFTNYPVTGGSISLGTIPGTAAITTGTGASAVTYNFDVFPIDATHLKFIEIDTLPILAGDAFTQTSSIPTGNNVFTVAGFDNNTSVQGPFTAAGILHADGNGNIVSDSVEDINDFSVASEVTFTGTYTPLSGGRSEITFTSGFINGNNGTACAGSCIFAAYPSSGGLQLLEIDDGGSTNGIAYPQTATTLASGEGYGMNLSGVVFNTTSSSAEDDIGEFTNNNGTFGPGIIDFNDQGTMNFRNTFQSNYTADTAVSGRGTVTPTKNGYLLTTYVIDSSTAVAVSTDTGFVGLGALVKQNASAKSNAAAAHLSVLRAATATATGKANRSKRPAK